MSRANLSWFYWVAVVAAMAGVGCDDGSASSTIDTGNGSDAAADIGHDLGPPVNIPDTIPTADEWLAHLNNEILPYWLVTDALGDPEGNFPTFRCDDGTAYNSVTNDCPELSETPEWFSSELGRQYIRMMARQTYLYGAAFHLTGEERLFELHQAGTEFLLETAFDPTGGSYTFIERSGAVGPDSADRTSQDLSFALLGLAMNYYLTRDPTVLAEIENQREYIFNEYWDDDIDMLRWTRENIDNQQELVAQLDQLNSYLVLLYRLVPLTTQNEWRANLAALVEVLVSDFYDWRYNLFWGGLTPPTRQELGTMHTDFGHTINAMRMIYLVGRLFDDESLQEWSSSRAPSVFEEAYLTETGPYEGAWGDKLTGLDPPDPAVAPGTEWWSYIELNNMAATLALEDPTLLSYLETTYSVYFDRMVDPLYGGVYSSVANENDVSFAKAHLWKNGFYELEHIVVGIITIQALRRESVELYFAFHDDALTDVLVPYVFDGTVSDSADEPFENQEGYTRTHVTFSSLH